MTTDLLESLCVRHVLTREATLTHQYQDTYFRQTHVSTLHQALRYTCRYCFRSTLGIPMRNSKNCLQMAPCPKLATHHLLRIRLLDTLRLERNCDSTAVHQLVYLINNKTVFSVKINDRSLELLREYYSS